MRYRTLGKTGASLSVIGFGASPLGDVFGTIDKAEGLRAVRLAIDSGINFFDVSPYYGHTLAEERLGEALEGVRNEVFLATKVGRYGPSDFNFSAARVSSSIHESLSRLRTDRIDLLQAHDIEFADARQIVEETIPAMRRAQQEGLVRFIGITGYPLGMLHDVAVKAPVDTILSYCRYNLLISDMDDALTPYARMAGVGLLNASPLHMGLLTENRVPDWHPASPQIRSAAKRVVGYCEAQNLDPASIALAFCLRHPYVTSTLIGMRTCTEVRNNLKALDLELSQELLSHLARLVGDDHNVTWASGLPQNADARSATEGILQ